MEGNEVEDLKTPYEILATGEYTPMEAIIKSLTEVVERLNRRHWHSFETEFDDSGITNGDIPFEDDGGDGEA